MHKLIIISTLLFAAACGHNKAPAASSTASQNSTAAPATKSGDKDGKVDEGAKDKEGDADGDEGPAKPKHN
jgi:hypothetical protein